VHAYAWRRTERVKKLVSDDVPSGSYSTRVNIRVLRINGIKSKTESNCKYWYNAVGPRTATNARVPADLNITFARWTQAHLKHHTIKNIHGTLLKILGRINSFQPHASLSDTCLLSAKIWLLLRSQQKKIPDFDSLK
jgi:hypothetical protein